MSGGEVSALRSMSYSTTGAPSLDMAGGQHTQTSAISARKRGARRRAPTRREHFPAYVIASPARQPS